MTNRTYFVEDHVVPLWNNLSPEHYRVWQRRTEELEQCSVERRTCARCPEYKECVRNYDTLCSHDAKVMAMKLSQQERN